MTAPSHRSEARTLTVNLREDLKLRHVAWRYARAWGSPDAGAIRGYLWPYLRPWSARRRRLRLKLKINLAITDLVALDPPSEHRRRVAALASDLPKRALLPYRATRFDYLVHYNLACFYSLAMPADLGTYSDRSLHHLRGAVSDPASDLSRTWLDKDPDLELLRKHCRHDFEAVRDLAAPEPKVLAKSHAGRRRK
jgi:hypothetical protein